VESIMALDRLLSSFCFFLFILSFATAYEVPVLDTDYSRQICSGMWGGHSTYINVSFDSTSQGQLAIVVYEWNDMQYLGKVTSTTDESLPKTYVCTSNAVAGGFCSADNLGRFILDFPPGKSINDTSFWSASVGFHSANATNSPSSSRNNRADYSAVTIDENTLKFRPRSVKRYSRYLQARQQSTGSPLNVSPSGIYWYEQPIQYNVRKTGYYCVAIVPVTLFQAAEARAPTDVPFHPAYKGLVLFRNTFDGKLPATDYPKVNFYFTMSLLYLTFGCAWAWLCYKHQYELLPIQV
jgi:hypothetical protein